MNAVNDLIASIKVQSPVRGQVVPVQDVLVGLHWTAVASRGVGLAATPNNISCCHDQDVPWVGKLHEHPALELVDLLNSSHPLEACVGMAALNSLIQVNQEAGIDLNARELLQARSQNKKTALIGHFPFAGDLRKTARELWVLEIDPAEGDYPASAASELLPQAEVIGITASTLINGTFDDLSRLFSPQAFVVMLGPSSPLSPVLFDHGVDVLAGSLVTHPQTLFRYIAQGSRLSGVPGLRRFMLSRNKLS